MIEPSEYAMFRRFMEYESLQFRWESVDKYMPFIVSLTLTLKGHKQRDNIGHNLTDKAF